MQVSVAQMLQKAGWQTKLFCKYTIILVLANHCFIISGFSVFMDIRFIYMTLFNALYLEMEEKNLKERKLNQCPMLQMHTE